MIHSSLCDFSNAYVHVKAAVTVPNTAAEATSEIIIKVL